MDCTQVLCVSVVQRSVVGKTLVSIMGGLVVDRLPLFMARGNFWRWGVLEMPGLVENIDHSLVFFVGRNAGVF